MINSGIGRLRLRAAASLVAVFGLAFSAHTACAQNLLQNGSFESNDGLNATGWTIANNVQSGPYSDYGLYARAAAGASDGSSYVVLNTGDSRPGASISQTFATTAGTSYTLQFDYVGGPSWRTDLQSVDVAITNSDFTPVAVRGDATGNWKTFTYTFKAAGATSTITFTDDPNNNTVSQDGALDNVRIVANAVTVFGSGISKVTTWDPIFPATAYPDWTALSTPMQLVGPGPNANWVNPHDAFVFPKGTHPWEFVAPMNFDANWINAWSNITSRGPAGQSWTKYSTTVTGEGDFVLQFLADNVSWIYIDGALVGYQAWNWDKVGTGRYTIHLTGSAPHELVFIIWDGGGAAGGKFRLETTQSFLSNGGGTLPPPPPPTDTTAPVITAPVSVTKEATSANGAVATFTATALDDVSGAVPVTASPASGSTFALGTTMVRLSATDAAGNTATATFPVNVVDTTAPSISNVPANITAEATGPNGAAVTFGTATATDLVDGNVAVVASATSGATFSLGTTTVTLSATDAHGNAATKSFTVLVQDTTAPKLTLPANLTLEATSAAGAKATFAATATDAVTASPTITYDVAPGSTFAIGATTVNVTATDAAGNKSTGAFTVTVRDTTPPAIVALSDLTIEATSAAGAVASFSTTATDIVDGSVAVSGSPASGSTFALGTTKVTLTATDAHGNAATSTFNVTVRDTTAPTLTVPANLTLEATSAAGAVANFAATATDAVTSSPTIGYSVVPGSTFALGTTTVNVSATDAAGNKSTGAFTVTVRDTTPPAITSVTPSVATIWPPNKKMVAETIKVVASDAVGIASARIISVATNEPNSDVQWQITGPLTLNLLADRLGTGTGRIYTITVEVRDAAGNASTMTTTVSVPHDQGK